MDKSKFSVQDQIAHMRDVKGIKFNIIQEDEAEEFLSTSNYYFRIKSYAKNFEKYPVGINQDKYINLEFAYLKELSIIDWHLRQALLPMVLEIEHYSKMQLINDCTNNENEDGYAIVKNSGVNFDFEKKANNSYSRNLITKYKMDFSIWNIVEITGFGDFIRLYEYYYKQYLSKKNYTSLLWSVRILRNALAHNNCLLNSLKYPYTTSRFNFIPNQIVVKYLSDNVGSVTKNVRQKWLKNPVLHDLTATLQAYNLIIGNDSLKKERYGNLLNIFSNRFLSKQDFFVKNNIICSAYCFLGKVIDFYGHLY